MREKDPLQIIESLKKLLAHQIKADQYMAVCAEIGIEPRVDRSKFENDYNHTHPTCYLLANRDI